MNKGSGGDGIPAELFKILKDDAVKVLHSVCQHILETSAVATGLEKVSFHSDSKVRQSQRLLRFLHSCAHLTCWQGGALSLQARLQQCVSQEHPDVQAGFRKGGGTRDQIASICWIIERAREFQKIICFIDYAKAFDCGSQQTGKFFKRWEYQTHLTYLLRNLYAG